MRAKLTSSLLLTVLCLGEGASVARAESEVSYRAWADGEYTVSLTYRFAEPESQADLDADPMAYMRRVNSMQLGSEPWEEDSTMDDPARWAWISVGGAGENAPTVHCQILVNGAVLFEQSARVGVVCGKGRFHQ